MTHKNLIKRRVVGGKILLVLLLSGICLFSTTTHAVNDKVLKTEITGLLARMPAESMQERDRLCAGLIKTGTEGLIEICRMLKPPGKVDDSQARFALSALTAYVTIERNQAARKIFVRIILTALKSNVHPEVKAFLIRQLQTCGNSEVTEPLAVFLEDDRLCEPAAQALMAIRAPGVEKVFEEALPSAKAFASAKAFTTVKGKRLVTIIKALGELGEFTAAAKIKKYMYSKEPALKWTAFYALSNMGYEGVAPVLSRLLKRPAEGKQEQDRALSLYLLFIQRLYDRGEKEKAVNLCRGLMKLSAVQKNPHRQSMVLSTLVSLLKNKSLDYLLTAVDSPSHTYRKSALRFASAVPGPKATQKWMKKAADVGPQVRTEIITMLGKRGDETALSFVLAAVEQENKAVRLAAIPAAARLGKGAAIPGMLTTLLNGKTDEVAAVRQALLTISGAKVVTALASSFSSMPGFSRAAAMDIFAARLATEQLGLVTSQLKSSDIKTRISAVRALRHLGTKENLPLLTGIFLNAASDEERKAVKGTVIALSNQALEKERADFLLKLLPKADKARRCFILETLAGIGGEKALAAVINDRWNTDPEIEGTAIRALTNWIDYKACAALFDIGLTATKEEHHKLALQSYVNLTVNAGLSPQKKLRMCKDALAIARFAEEKQLILTSLGTVKLYETLDFLESYFDDPELRFAAADAAGYIILPQTGKNDGLYGPKTARQLEKAIKISKDDYLKEQCVTYLETMSLQKPPEFASLFNGRDLTGWKGLVADPPARAIMKPEELAKLQRKADKKMRKHWKVKKGVLCFDGKGHSLCTKKDYKDFEMLVDWKIGKHGDSGIYLRGSPQVQIWDPAQWPEGSGGLYNNKKHPNKPLLCVDNPIGRWNTFRIIMKGERVTVYLNDVLVVDDVVMENFWERDKPIYPIGQIELQAHNSFLYFRNIYIKPLNPE